MNIQTKIPKIETSKLVMSLNQAFEHAASDSHVRTVLFRIAEKSPDNLTPEQYLRVINKSVQGFDNITSELLTEIFTYDYFKKAPEELRPFGQAVMSLAPQRYKTN